MVVSERIGVQRIVGDEAVRGGHQLRVRGDRTIAGRGWVQVAGVVPVAAELGLLDLAAQQRQRVR
jgi:hypothetical protein